jgi:chromosome segregation ATPase
LTKSNNKDAQILDRRQQLPRRLLVKDMSVIVASKKAEIQAKEAELREARDSQPNFDQEDRELTRRNAATDQVLRNCSDQLRVLRKSKASIEDKLKEHQEARNINTTYLEEEERELTEALENSDKVILEMQESNADLTAEKARLKAEQTALTAAKDEASNVIADVTSRFTSIIDNIQKHKRAVDSARSNMERTLKILTQTSKTVEKTEEERNLALEVATEETRNRVQNWDGEPLPVSKKDKDKKKLEQTVKLLKDALEKSELL